MSDYQICEYFFDSKNWSFDHVSYHIVLDTKTLCGRDVYIHEYPMTGLPLYQWTKTKISVEQFVEQCKKTKHYYCKKCLEVYEKENKMYISEEKKNEFWDHFSEKILATKFYGYSGKRIGKRFMNKAKITVWNNKDFWEDVIIRHGGLEMTPDEIDKDHHGTYIHCFGNFIGMIVEFTQE